MTTWDTLASREAEKDLGSEWGQHALGPQRCLFLSVGMGFYSFSTPSLPSACRGLAHSPWPGLSSWLLATGGAGVGLDLVGAGNSRAPTGKLGLGVLSRPSAGKSSLGGMVTGQLASLPVFKMTVSIASSPSGPGLFSGLVATQIPDMCQVLCRELTHSS